MSFQVTGHIVQIGETEKKSDAFSVRQFAIKIADGGKYDNFAGFQAVQDRCALLDTFSEGDEVTVHFDLRGREWNGRYFTNLQAWKIETAAYAPEDKPEPGPAPSTENLNPESGDDLPF